MTSKNKTSSFAVIQSILADSGPSGFYKGIQVRVCSPIQYVFGVWAGSVSLNALDYEFVAIMGPICSTPDTYHLRNILQ